MKKSEKKYGRVCCEGLHFFIIIFSCLLLTRPRKKETDPIIPGMYMIYGVVGRNGVSSCSRLGGGFQLRMLRMERLDYKMWLTLNPDNPITPSLSLDLIGINP